MIYKTTTNYDEIRTWIEEHDGEPAIVAGTTNESSRGVLRVNFTGDSRYRAITWEEFFDLMESNNLAFEYNDNGIEGSPEENFNFVDRKNTPEAPEDDTELPDAGDQEVSEGNIFSSEPEDHEPKKEGSREEELLS